MNKFQKIHSKHLELRMPSLDDVPDIVRHANNDKIARNLSHQPYPYTNEHAAQMVGRVAKGQGTLNYGYGIYLDQGSGPFIGFAVIGQANRDVPLLGFWLGEEHWNKGYITEVANALIEFAFEELEAPALRATVFDDNPASRRVLEKCGFREMEKAMLKSKHRGGFAPGMMMRLEVDDWKNRV
jgi:RimJ/RimL family protein N-acetyltransferase